MSFATKEQLEALAAYMASKISVPTIGIGGGYAPIGTIISYMGTTAPADYLACDGSVVNIADYPQLATFFETQFGSKNYFGGNGVTTFGVPSLPSPSGADYIYCIKYREQNTYSTDEQRVGTWIDGKPLYQKTVTGTTPASNGEVTIGTENNITNCFMVHGYYTDANGYNADLNFDEMVGGYGIACCVKDDGTKAFFSVGVNSASRPFVITIVYTKSTD